MSGPSLLSTLEAQKAEIKDSEVKNVAKLLETEDISYDMPEPLDYEGDSGVTDLSSGGTDLPQKITEIATNVSGEIGQCGLVRQADGTSILTPPMRLSNNPYQNDEYDAQGYGFGSDSYTRPGANVMYVQKLQSLRRAKMFSEIVKLRRNIADTYPHLIPTLNNSFTVHMDMSDIEIENCMNFLNEFLESQLADDAFVDCLKAVWNIFMMAMGLSNSFYDGMFHASIDTPKCRIAIRIWYSKIVPQISGLRQLIIVLGTLQQACSMSKMR